jgi:hypothetical protein
MKIAEPYIVYSAVHRRLIKLYKTYKPNGMGVEWFTEVGETIEKIHHVDALNMLD